ncbi:MAG: methylmalonyl-CoA mutase family protein, partial [Acidaminococcaceae bacterium]
MKTEELEALQTGLSKYEAKVAQAVAKTPARKDFKVKALYTPLDCQESNYLEKEGFPGSYPFTRGVQPTMYRG